MYNTEVKGQTLPTTECTVEQISVNMHLHAMPNLVGVANLSVTWGYLLLQVCNWEWINMKGICNLGFSKSTKGHFRILLILRASTAEGMSIQRGSTVCIQVHVHVHVHVLISLLNNHRNNMHKPL